MVFTEYMEKLKDEMESFRDEEALSGESAFFVAVTQDMVEHGVMDNITNLSSAGDCKVGNKVAHLDGYSFDETDRSLSLYISDYEDSDTPARLTSPMMDKLYWRLYYFLEAACSESYAKAFNESTVLHNAALTIRTRMYKALSDPERVLKIHLVLLTNRELDTKLLSQDFFKNLGRTHTKKKQKTRKRIKLQEFDDRPIDIDLWPIDRLYEIAAGDRNELIEIDFADEFDSPGIPCLKGNVGVDLEYEAYIGIVPGKLLADIYIEHGSRVLEGNVRAFLGTKSAKGVNNGIKRTINNEPTNFFTYNNGIAATATSITTEIRDGQMFITGITDFQIINGGQTTATLAEAVLKKTNPSLEGIYVPFKLTVIADREKETEDGVLVYDQMIHDIARFANSQNKVTAADLFSNDPFHIWMEKASKKYLAPAVHYNIPTGWYYERSRKKYQQEQFKLKGDAAKRFIAKYPKKQIITKEQLAMYLTAIAGKPHLCAKGKNWVMREYGSEIGEIYKKDRAMFNEYYFKKCICAAIIYMTVDHYLESNKKDPEFWYSAGGYKGNIVPYAIAKIVHSIPAGYTFNWPEIWNNQSISDAFMEEVSRATYLANEYFCGFNGVLVSEHCKKETTWTEFRDTVPYEVSEKFIEELIPTSLDKELSKSALKEQKDTNELSVVMEVIQKGEDYWRGILETAKERNFMTKQETVFIMELISLAHKGKIPCSSSGKVPSKTMTMVRKGLEIEAKLNDEGVLSYFDADDDVAELVLTDYKMH